MKLGHPDIKAFIHRCNPELSEKILTSVEIEIWCSKFMAAKDYPVNFQSLWT
jgi:hypothetical protein